MFNSLRKELLAPLVRRPRPLQVAALCWREAEAGREILLVTSRRSKRWIIPKGWPIKGQDGAGTALQEAWEEAGVQGKSTSEGPIGRYIYDKRDISGVKLPCEVLVYPIKVRGLDERYPECDQRERTWVPPKTAAQMVTEPSLKAILEQF
ncbi:NUDIX hydrolase [Acuticoccus sp. M5D2P5]|uniref:NUDIX hydrolase n=1 Tax=Acuticoccus kalidii TaxID=2910977 RepID=UPI001F345028|nr:NUDIX hydrolase [Acuticoccus kalidii]MCF3934379.1 NUDIX hydrolase [Acuticoccus kalidii]